MDMPSYELWCKKQSESSDRTRHHREALKIIDDLIWAMKRLANPQDKLEQRSGLPRAFAKHCLLKFDEMIGRFLNESDMETPHYDAWRKKHYELNYIDCGNCAAVNITEFLVAKMKGLANCISNDPMVTWSRETLSEIDAICKDYSGLTDDARKRNRDSPN